MHFVVYVCESKANTPKSEYAGSAGVKQ